MHFIGIDVHKHICTAVVIDESERIVAEYDDFPTSEKGLDEFISNFDPNDCRIVFENLTRAHFVFHYLYSRGYAVDVAHTGHGALKNISNVNLKSDKVDACKLAYLCKDIWSGRLFIRRTHISGQENMKLKALVRMNNECSKIVEEMKLRVLEYMNLHNITPHPRYKDVCGIRYRYYLLKMDDPALTVMVNMISAAKEQIDYVSEKLKSFSERSEDMKLLKTIKGVSDLTAATIVTAIDGIYRFDSPQKLSAFFGLGLKNSSSADSEKTKVITKEGDPLVRKYLANVVLNLSTRCPECDVSKFFNAKRERMPYWKAATAAMRKLTCAIWAILTYREPFRFHPGKRTEA